MEPILVLIPQETPGLQGFITTWICGRDPNIIIDVGTSSSVRRLAQSLMEMNLRRIDFVLLTHIHLDHAGGLADFVDLFPMAKVICHASGIRHLVDPSKLWEASLKTLGELARSYGPPSPVKEEAFIPHTQAAIPGLEVIETPGHAAHHLSFTYHGNLFVGEAAGVYYEEREGYLRPAAPPPFFMKESLASMERLNALGDRPIFFAHSGRAPSSQSIFKRAKDQYFRWERILNAELSKGKEGLMERCLRQILQLDPDLEAFQRMSPEEQRMEMVFLTNSITGFLGYLEKQRK